MSREQNIAATERFGKEVVSEGKLDVIDEVMQQNVVDNDPAPEQGPGAEGFKQFFATLREAFPDLEVSVEHMVADEENVAIAYTLQGTHDGEFMGVAPTGRHVKARGMQIARFEDGKIAERWGSSDELGILKQLDVQAVPA